MRREVWLLDVGVLIATFGIGAASLGAGIWMVVRSARRQRDTPEGQAYQAAVAQLDPPERRSVRRLVKTGQASDDPRLAAAAVALVRLVRATERPASRRPRTAVTGLLTLFFLVAAIDAVRAFLQGLDQRWMACFLAVANLAGLVGYGVVDPRQRRRQSQRLAAAEQGNLAALERRRRGPFGRSVSTPNAATPPFGDGMADPRG